MIIHLVYPDGPVFAAACGQPVDLVGGHTGQYARSLRLGLAWGLDVCDACVQLLEAP